VASKGKKKQSHGGGGGGGGGANGGGGGGNDSGQGANGNGNGNNGNGNGNKKKKHKHHHDHITNNYYYASSCGWGGWNGFGWASPWNSWSSSPWWWSNSWCGWPSSGWSSWSSPFWGSSWGTSYWAGSSYQPYATYLPYSSSTYDPYASNGFTTDAYAPEPAPTWSVDQAWDLLADGDFISAREIFGAQIDALPNDAYARIGFGIATAMLGNHEAGTHAVRRAMRDDYEAIRYVPEDPRLAQSLASLAEFYGRRAQDAQYGDPDALFMVGAMQYLLGNFEQAHYALEVGREQGDLDGSIVNLRALVEAAVAASA
jgi:hypothetical protein